MLELTKYATSRIPQLQPATRASVPTTVAAMAPLELRDALRRARSAIARLTTNALAIRTSMLNRPRACAASYAAWARARESGPFHPQPDTRALPAVLRP